MPPQSLSIAEPISNAAVRNMFEARKRVFVDLLKWDVPVLDNRYEVDQFDTPEAEYLILTGEDGKHRASARLLRTDSAHILRDLFPSLCETELPSGAETREITRFCIEPTLNRLERRQARNQLVTALVQHALSGGITAYTAVANLAWYRQIAEFGWKCRALGSARHIGGEFLLALHINIDAETPGDLAATGIFSPTDFHLVDAGAMQ
jgi:N-acyl-L-homoserine lactone synthetase